MSVKTIMIIEDDADTLKLLEKSLEFHKYKTVSYLNGLNAVEDIKKHKPDLILLDVMMPEKSGYTVCEEIREVAEIRHIPIFMVSAKVFKEDIKKGLMTGANDYITKPFDPQGLAERIHKFLMLTAMKDDK